MTPGDVIFFNHLRNSSFMALKFLSSWTSDTDLNQPNAGQLNASQIMF